MAIKIICSREEINVCVNRERITYDTAKVIKSNYFVLGESQLGYTRINTVTKAQDLESSNPDEK